MRSLYSVMAVILALGVVTPGPAAAAHAALSYDFRLTGTLYSGMYPTGRIEGTLGGIAVGGAYSGGGWSLAAYGRPFASGRYACIHICTFTGTRLGGRAAAYVWTSQVPTWDARTQTAEGQIPGVFASRRDWIARVAAWARATALPPALRTRVIVDAETGI